MSLKNVALTLALTLTAGMALAAPRSDDAAPLARGQQVGERYALFVYSQKQGPRTLPGHKDRHSRGAADLHLASAGDACVTLDFGHSLCPGADLVLDNIKPLDNGARFEVDGIAVTLTTSTKPEWLAMSDARAIVERLDGVYITSIMGMTPDQVAIVGEDWLEGRDGKQFFTRVFVDNKSDQTGGGLLIATMLHKAPDHVIRVSLKKQGLTNSARLNGALRKVLTGLSFGQ